MTMRAHLHNGAAVVKDKIGRASVCDSGQERVVFVVDVTLIEAAKDLLE